MRHPRPRTMSEHELTQELVRGVVDALMQSEAVVLNHRLYAVHSELEKRLKAGREMCRCEDCWEEISDPFEV